MPRQTRSASRRQAEGQTEITTTDPPPVTAVPKITAQPAQDSTQKPVTVIKTTAMETLPFKTLAAWETWLATHHTTKLTGLWVKISKKASGIPSVTYDEAVDAALCYGWIDGQRKSLDHQYFIQRFTPRRKKSVWSQRNVDKVAVLIESGRMRPAGLLEVDAAKADGRWERAYSSSKDMVVPDDLEAALRKNKVAKGFFEGLNKSQRYSFLFRIVTADGPETREKRIRQTVALLAKREIA